LLLPVAVGGDGLLGKERASAVETRVRVPDGGEGVAFWALQADDTAQVRDSMTRPARRVMAGPYRRVAVLSGAGILGAAAVRDNVRRPSIIDR
jgi:hypothetical protein